MNIELVIWTASAENFGVRKWILARKDIKSWISIYQKIISNMQIFLGDKSKEGIQNMLSQ